MHEESDVQLLRDYAEDGNEAAFRELVTRHTDLVYSAALRQVFSPDLAGDITQSVFTDLARKAKPVAEKLQDKGSLAGWLHRGTRYAALSQLRDTRCRLANERQAMEQLLTNSESAPDWEHIRPVLDEALDSLGEEDREALLLRYFKNQDFRAVGLALGVSDDAAQKRVSRAVEGLREFFVKRGVTVGASGLVVLIAANAVQAAPAGLAVTISTAAVLVGGAVSTPTAIAATKIIAMTTLQKTFVAATLAAAIGTGVYQAHQASNLRQQVQTLQGERDAAAERLAALSAKLSLRLPAPPMQVTAQAAAPTNALVGLLQLTNLYTRFKDKQPKLTAEQVEAYLKANGRKASSLLAAYRTSGDPSLLQEAMQKYPDDPQVDFEAVFNKNLSREERRQWLNAFEKSAPDNALANYLSALNYFKGGQTDQAVQELIAANGKARFQDYLPNRIQDDEEAYLSAGYSMIDAETAAVFREASLPQPSELRQFVHNISDLATSYRQAGDATSAQAALQTIADLGQRYESGSPGQGLVSQNIGISIERFALGAMDPHSPYGGNLQTIQDRLNQLDQQLAAHTALTQQGVPLRQTMSDQDWISYCDRIKASGEEVAWRWLVNKYGQQ